MEKEQSHILSIVPVAYIESDFTTKFGIPRQSGLVPEQQSRLVFTPEYRDENALRGLEGFSRLWLIWGFSAVYGKGWSPTVKPPKLGGNTRRGVFATRSPFRPNPLGLSSAALLDIRKEKDRGTVLLLGGADLMDGTPVYDIKPYLPYTDSHPEERAGFADTVSMERLPVDCPENLLQRIPAEKRAALLGALSLDPRPGYLVNGEEPYGFAFAGTDVRFRVIGGRVQVFDILPDGE